MIKKWLPGFIGLSILALLGRLLGLFREILMASKFGASDVTDAYLTTLILFDIAIAANASILSGTLSYYSEQNRSFPSLNNIIKTGLKILGLLTIAALIFYPFIDDFVNLIFAKSDEVNDTITNTAQLLFFLLAFVLASGLFSAALQRRGFVTNPGRLTIYLNVASILFLILFSNNIGIISLPLGFLAGGSIFFLFQLFLLQKENRLSPIINNGNLELAGWGSVIVLIFANSLFPSISGFIERFFAYNFSEGTFSHYQYATKIILLPLTIVSYAISTSLLPLQTQSINEGNKKVFADSTNSGIFISVITSIFFALLISSLSEQLTKLIYEHGNFTQFDSSETAHALKIMSFGLIPFLVNPIIINIFYALNAVKNLIYINAVFIVIQIFLLLFLTKFTSGIEALTFTWLIVVWLSNISQFIYLSKYKQIHFNNFLMIKLLIFFFISGMIYMIYYTVVDSLFLGFDYLNKWVLAEKIFYSILIMTVTYIFLTFLLFSEDYKELLAQFRKK